MAPTSSESLAPDTRTAPRTSIFLAATLHYDGSWSPVRIRNISATGALLEAAVIPKAGAPVRLVRGGLTVDGLVAWSIQGRCGLKFSGPIDVQRWRAAASNMQQQRVDNVVRLVKVGGMPIPSLRQSAARAEMPNSDSDVARDLRRIADLLARMSEDLAGNSDIVIRHGPSLQNLDIAMQMLAALEAMNPEGRRPDGHASKLEALRRSAGQALERDV